jgi:hypothetical protein
MSDNPIERLIAAGHTEILEAAGFYQSYGHWHHRMGYGSDAVSAEFCKDHIQFAGMAAFAWLARTGRMAYPPTYDESNEMYGIDVEMYPPNGVRNFEAPTLAEAAIDAAIAVWEASRGN